MMFKRPVAFINVVIALIICMLTSVQVKSQPVPSFTMQLTNGKTFSNKNLSHTRPLILIYFAPDCEHCQLLMDAIFKKFSKFKTAQFIMVTFKPINEVAEFENHYQIKKYKNITTGTEVPIFLFRKYYQVDNTPFTALYDKKGNLVVSYKKETPVDDLLKHLDQLK